MKPLRPTVTDRSDGLELAFSYSYTGKLPKAPIRREAIREILQRAIEALEGA